MNKFLCILILSFISQIASAKEIGWVMVKHGESQITRNGKALPTKVGEKVSEGDEFVTSGSAYLKIVMGDRNVIVVTENSKFKIEQYSEVKKIKNVKISLEYGSLRHALKQKYQEKEEHYEVKMATAVAGVRGTDFITEFNQTSGDTVLCALEGVVSFDLIKDGKEENNPVVVNAGNFIRFKKADVRPNVIETKKAWLEKALILHRLN